MKIVFTKHAKDMLNLRGIKKTQVRKCLQKPDKILPAKFGKKAYLKDFGKNYLKVIVSEEMKNKAIVTLYWLDKKRVKM